LNSKK